MTVYEADTFTRANVGSGWGTASNGDTWTKQAGTGTQSVTSNEGLLTSSAASFFMTLGSSSQADVDALVRLSIGNTTSTAGILLRWQNTSNHWLCRFDGAGHLVAMVKVSNSYTTLSPSVTFAPTINTFYWIRFRVQGSTISIKHWQDGTSEPSAWDQQYTNSSIASAGPMGLYGFAQTSSTNKYDSFSASNPPVTSSRTVPTTGALTATGLVRSVPTTGATKATGLSRSVPASGQLKALQVPRSVPVTGQTKATGVARQVPATGQTKATGLTRSVPVTGQLGSAGTTFTRSVPMTGQLQALQVPRSVPVTGQLQALHVPRSVPTAGQLKATGLTRSVPVVGRLRTGGSRTVPATGQLKALQIGRAVPATGALKALGLARQVPTTGALGQHAARSVPATGKLKATSVVRSVPAIARLHGTATRTVPATGALKSAGLSRTVPTTGRLKMVLGRTVPSIGQLKATGIARTVPVTALIRLAGTGIGGLTVGSHSQAWSGGPGGSPGTATDVVYKDAQGYGAEVATIPGYGGANIASWYEIDNNNGPTGSNTATNQHSLTTSTPDGWVHEFTDKGGSFVGSEDFTYTASEQAPTGTDFRRYYLAQKTSADSNGFEWNVYTCIYPGDPMLIMETIQCINPTGSAITLAGSDGMEVALIAGLEQADTTWVPGNGGYGTVGGSNTSGWPSALTNGQPDYFYILPASASGINLGAGAVKLESLSALTPAWSSLQFQYLQNTSRLKVKVQGTVSSFPGSTTHTIHILRVLKRNLTSSDMAAIAADILAPGTPTASVGSYTAFRTQERAYEFAAGAQNTLSASLDLSPAHVTRRYKPIIKVTGWTATNTPGVTWGGVALLSGVDYRYTIDATNQILYLQLYFDVVSSGATAPFTRTNATLALAGAATFTRSVPASGVLKALQVGRQVPSAGNLKAAGLTRTVPTSGRLKSTSLTRSVPTTGTLAASGLKRSVPAAGALKALQVGRPVPATAKLRALSLPRLVPTSGALAGQGLARSVPTAGRVLAHLARSVPVTAKLRTGGARSIPVMGRLRGLQSGRQVPTTGKVKVAGLARQVPVLGQLVLGTHHPVATTVMNAFSIATTVMNAVPTTSTVMNAVPTATTIMN